MILPPSLRQRWSGSNMRLFIAIDFPKEIKNTLQDKIRHLRNDFPQVSWVKPENIHLTLKFLGRVEEHKLPKIKKAILAATETISPFELSFTNFGYFDKGYLVIWLGIYPAKKLIDLVENIERETKKLGFPFEKRAYSPHLTFGRGKRLGREMVLQIKDKVRMLPSPQMHNFLVSEIILMQSTLSPHGAFYSPVEKFALS